jgi:DNA topoisomerase-1
MRHLVIVESPSKCKTIERYLGDDYRVIATCGHFRGLNSLEQINRDTFDITFKNTKPKIVKYLKEEVGIAKSVYLATDDDREGEAIAWHICQVCKLPLHTPRILFHEITKEAIDRAIRNPTTLSMSKVMAQHTRQILDVYIGFSVSPLLWKAIQHTLSAGRCQTPALHMIAEQEDLIQDHSNDSLNGVKPYFTNKRIEFTLERKLTPEEVIPFLTNIEGFVL